MGKKFAAADFFELQERLAAKVKGGLIEDIVDRVKDELAEPEIMIYCCAACGDYLCGGVTVDVDIGEKNATWTFADAYVKTVFTFDKYTYLDTMKSYLTKIKVS